MPPAPKISNLPAKLAGAFSGMLFGIYWILLRQLDAAGLTGVWAVVVFTLVPLCVLLPFLCWRWRAFFPGRARFHAGCVSIGLAYVCYSNSFLYTTVVSAIALFYLFPIWGFLLARIFIGDKITKMRWLAMLLALSGLGVMFGLEDAVPLPQNFGDWMAVCASIFWAGGSLLILMDESDTLNDTIGVFLWGSLFALFFAAVAVQSDFAAQIELARVWAVLWWLLPVTLLILIPTTYASLYAASKLNPGVAGLLFMTEVSVATITAALFAGEPFGVREVTGVLLITAAGVGEPFAELFASRGKKSGAVNV